MKRIVVEARMIDSSTGRYIQSLLHNLNQSFADSYEIIALVPSKSQVRWQHALPHIAVYALDQPSYSLQEQTSLARAILAHNPDLVHFTMPQQPFIWGSRVPIVTSILDLTLVHYDNIDGNALLYKAKKLVFIRLLKIVLQRSKAIIAITNYVKQDIATTFGRQYLTKTQVTLLAGEIINASPKPLASVADKKFLFFVGNAFPYKNVRRIIDAFAKLKQTTHPDLHLVLAGKKEYFYDQLEHYANTQAIKDIHFAGFITDGQKKWCFQRAECYVTASLSEGFNMPILEAMHESCPVVVSNTTCHPEVAGDSALYFDPSSTEDLVRQLRRVINSSKLRHSMAAKGRRWVATFSWKKMTDETIAVYRRVLRES